MTPRRCNRLTVLTLLQLLTYSTAQISSPFDCHITSGNLQYDLTSLAGERSVSRTRTSPPTEMIDTVTFDLCADLHQKDGVSEADQCYSGTRACLTKTNRKEGEADRIVAVVPVALSSGAVSYNTNSSSQSLILSYPGASYPDPSGSDPIPQTFHVKLLCTKDASEPQFLYYNHSDLLVVWRTPAACSSSEQPDAPPDDKPDGGIGDGSDTEGASVGSGLGYFFLLLFLSFAAYFALGAYYNYSTYGATGLDLIPHRDFWREVPYMLRDVVSHLCSSVRSRQTASRAGYVAV